MSRIAANRRPSNTKTQGKFAKILASHRKDASRSLRRLLRTPWSSLMTVFVIAVALLLPVLLLLMNANLTVVLDQFQHSARITLYLASDVSESRGIEVSESLLTNDSIEAADYVSSSQALAEFSAASGFSDILDSLTSNPLPAAIIVRPGQTGPAAIDELAGGLRALPEVELVELDSQWLRRLQAISDLLSVIARMLGVLVAVGLCFIVGNTIKLNIDNRRDEIRVMKLVGGDNAFIARPFLYCGWLYGIFGGLLACLLLWLVMWGLSAPLAELSRLYGGDFRLQGPGPLNLLFLAACGGLIGWFAALLASFRYIAAINP